MSKESNATTLIGTPSPDAIRRLRQSKRRGLSIAVNLVAAGVVSHVTLENVSSTGMGLRDWSGLTCPRDVEVQLPDGRMLSAAVCWVGKGRIGLRLVERLQQLDPLLQDNGLLVGLAPHRAKSVSIKFDTESASARTILVADAFRSVGLLMKGILEKAGNTVDVFDNGLAVIEAVRQKAYDLVLIDSQISMMSAAVAATRIRQMPSPFGQCSIIVVSSGSADNWSHGTTFDAHLVKPIRPAALLEQVADTLARHELNAMNELISNVSNAA
jgi:CheY-like chemotaxis protein